MAWDRQITIKSPEELEIMRAAGQINAEALAAANAIIRPGVSTADLNAAAEEVLKKYGVYSPFKNYPGPYPYPASTCVSVNEELVHGIPDKKRKLKEGDIVSMDCGTVYEGFVADSAFTAGVGEISPVARKLLETTEKSLYAGIAKMVPGNHIGDVSAAVQQFVESRGFTSHASIPVMVWAEQCTKAHRCRTMAFQGGVWLLRAGNDHRPGADGVGWNGGNPGYAGRLDGIFLRWFADLPFRALCRDHRKWAAHPDLAGRWLSARQIGGPGQLKKESV